MRHLPIKRVISLAAGILLALWVLALMIHMQGASQAALHSAARDRAQALVAYAARDMRRWIKEDKESELERLAQSLHETEEMRDQAIVWLVSREAELGNQISQTEAELRAAMEGLREARQEAEEMRAYIERMHANG